MTFAGHEAATARTHVPPVRPIRGMRLHGNHAERVRCRSWGMGQTKSRYADDLKRVAARTLVRCVVRWVPIRVSRVLLGLYPLTGLNSTGRAVQLCVVTGDLYGCTNWPRTVLQGATLPGQGSG